jgi:protein TonB
MKHRVVLSCSIFLLFLNAGYAQQEQAKANPPSATAPSESSPSPRVIHRVPPMYPQEAKEKGISGTVVVAVTVDKQGNVTTAKVVEGDKIFWESALTAVKAYKYEPAMLQGKPVAATVQVKILYCAKGSC